MCLNERSLNEIVTADLKEVATKYLNEETVTLEA
jgi:hypothetical protein